MKAGGGKQKGAAFEREICEKLSRWILPTSDRSLFWRSAMSGGRATVRSYAKKSTSDQAGDLCPIAPEGNAFMSRFVVECKHVKTLNIASGLLQGKQELATFWRQVSRDAALAEKKPLLVAKQNLYPTLALLRTIDYPVFFGHISQHERLRVFILGRPGAPSISMFFLDDLLAGSYVETRFKTADPH